MYTRNDIICQNWRESKECDIMSLLVFFKGFKFQPNVCNGCHDLLMSMNFNDIAILNIKGADFHCIISTISKRETKT